MFGWTTRFYEAMIKKQIKSSNICLLFHFFVAFFIFITYLTLSYCINLSPCPKVLLILLQMQSDRLQELNSKLYST
jgi:hypothetical protein